MSELTLEGTLKFALTREEESIKLYTSAQKKVLNPGSSKFLKELAEEEKTHKNRILDAMNDPKKVKEIGTLETMIQDLKIVDYLDPASKQTNP